jgi:hypothetical protein
MPAFGFDGMVLIKKKQGDQIPELGVRARVWDSLPCLERQLGVTFLFVILNEVKDPYDVQIRDFLDSLKLIITKLSINFLWLG